MTKNRHAVRKAAILVAALDHQSADALLEQMPEALAAEVRQAVMEMDPVDDQEQQQVIEQFVRSGVDEEAAPDRGVELDISWKLEEPATYEPPGAPPSRGLERVEPPFADLPDLDMQQLSELLSAEHPQTIAVVVSRLAPPKASELLQHLSPHQQTDVLRRIARLQDTDPEIVRDIQQQISARLSRSVESASFVSAGLDVLRSILDATEPERRQRLVLGLAMHDRQLTQQLEGSPRNPAETTIPAPRKTLPNRGADDSTVPRRAVVFEFADLVRLDDDSLAAVFTHAPPESAMIALTGASHEFVDRILGPLPAREARRFRRQMHQTGPLRLSDVEHAQRQLAKLASTLYQQGEIPLPVTRIRREMTVS